MYAGHDKFGGDVVGADAATGSNVAETLEGSSMEETVVVEGDLGNGPQELLLTARLNVAEGGLMWVPEENSSQTFKSVIAMSQMTSMLHDDSRNSKYDQAITAAVKTFIQKTGRKPIVLDVGTGTGLLAMMAVRAGAEHVYACEVFPTLAALATKIVEKNVGSAITVLGKMSTDLTIGPDGDLPRKADMLVSEILDSALLGEGVLPFLRHALTELVEEDAVVVPQGASVFAQVIDCPCIADFHDLTAPLPSGITLMRDERAARCDGDRVLLPVHVGRLRDTPQPLSEVITVFQFDFTTPSERKTGHAKHPFTTPRAGQIHGVLMWWDLVLFGDIVYSTRAGAENWQDHWLQVVYPLRTTAVEAAASMVLDSFHHDTAIWFAVGAAGKDGTPVSKRAHIDDEGEQAPHCSCGWHTLCGAQRIAALTDRARVSSLHAGLQLALERAPADTVCVDVSDGSLCALLLAGLGAARVVSVEAKPLSNIIMSQLCSANGFDERWTITDSQAWADMAETLEGSQIGLLCAEPFYYQMQNFSLYQALNFWAIRSLLAPSLSVAAVILPQRARVQMAMASFENLSVSHGTVGTVCGFDHSLLDGVQLGWDTREFPYPIGMYGCVFLSPVTTVMALDFQATIQDVSDVATLSCTRSGMCHALVSWMEYDLIDGCSWSTAPRAAPDGSKQLVRFFQPFRTMQEGEQLRVSASFSTESGEVYFEFL